MQGPGALLDEREKEVAAALDAMDRAPQVHFQSSEKLPLADGSVNLVLTSPPYPMIPMWDAQLEAWTGLGVDEPGFYRACHERLDEVWRECARVLAPGGIAAVNIGDGLRRDSDGAFRLFANHVDIHAGLERAGLTPLIPILWKKPTNKPNAFLGSGFLPTNAYVTLDCEHILLFRKGAPRKFPPKDLLRYASEFSKAERDAWFTQIWETRGVRQARDDMARRTGAFPLEIAERLVRMFSVLGDTVLDPFAGTGTTLRAAARWGRRSIGIELDESLRPALSDLSAPSGAEVVTNLREGGP